MGVEPRMDTNEHERIQNHEWTLVDTNVLNHEKHERHEKNQNHEWTRMDTNGLNQERSGEVRVGVARRPARTSIGRWEGRVVGENPRSLTIESEKMSKSHFSI